MLDDSLINRAAPPGSMRYFSVLYAPDDRRTSMLALYVIDAEIRESAHGANHDVAHTRLQWWRAEVDRLVNANPQHPATRLLHDQHADHRALFGKLHEVLAAADMDLARMTYTNNQELRAYSSRSGGAIQELIAAVLVSPESLDEASRALANRMGVGVRQTEMLRDLRRDAYDGRVYLPLDDLERNAISIEDLRAREVSPALRSALQGFRETARDELRAAAAAAHDERLRPLFVLGALHERLLDRIAARNFDVATERVDLGPIEKPWTAWRAARRRARPRPPRP